MKLTIKRREKQSSTQQLQKLRIKPHNNNRKRRNKEQKREEILTNKAGYTSKSCNVHVFPVNGSDNYNQSKKHTNISTELSNLKCRK